MKLLAVIALFLSPLLVSAALVWEPASQVQVVFAGRPVVIRQEIRNDGDAVVAQAVHLRLEQWSSTVAAPVKGWAVKKQLEVPARQALQATVDISLPMVTSPTKFQVRWQNEAGQVLGSTEVVGCPDDIFAPLREGALKKPLGVYGKADGLVKVLREQGCEVRELHSEQEIKNFNGAVLLVMWSKHTQAEQENFGRFAAQYAKEMGGKIVWLVEPDNLLPSPEPAVCVFTHGAGTLVVHAGLKSDELVQNPLSQLRLVWLVELALASEENRLALLGRLMKI